MGTSVKLAIAAAVLLVFIVVWMKKIRPKRIAAAEKAAKEAEAVLRKAEIARNRSMMDNVIPVLGDLPMTVDAIAQAISERCGETINPEAPAAALAWELNRGVKCRIALKDKEGFLLKENN